MKSLVYIDACMRFESSRTRRIAEPIITKLAERYTITKFVLNELPLEVVKKDLVQQRMCGNYDAQSLSWAKTIRDADRIVIAAPFWDMSYPAADPLEQATPYLKALSWLWGIGPMDVISAQNMDYVSETEVEKKVQQAIETGLHLVETW